MMTAPTAQSTTDPDLGPHSVFRITTTRPVAILMVVVAVAVFGAVSYRRLALTLMPDLSYPKLTVRTEYPGAAPEVKRFGRAFAPNDKVMQIRNDYDKDVFNGDIGRVADVDRGAKKITVRFDEKYVEYDIDELDSLQSAYAISVHKSQGSEYPAVVIGLASQHYVMLQRNLLYTAVTRGVRLVVIVGDKKALGMAVRNDHIRRRCTRLAERLRQR